MTDTPFGPGGYAYTGVVTPHPPLCEPYDATTALVGIVPDENPASTAYALINETDGLFVGADGGPSAEPVYATRDGWGTVAVTGLLPSTEYAFRVRAVNSDGTFAATGEAGTVTTHGRASAELAVALVVGKASSTVAAPSFMTGLAPDIRIAGKDMADFGFRADTVGGLDMPAVVPGETLVPGAHEWRVSDEYFAPKRIVLEGYIHGSSPEDLRLRLAYLKSFLATFDGNPWRSNTPVRLERSDLPDRHWNVLYSSADLIEMLGGRPGASSARLRIVMKSMMPCAESNDIFRERFTPSAGGFRCLDLGNAPSDAVYIVEGPASDPSFAVGDMTFLCDFNDGLGYSDALNEHLTGTFSPESGEAAAYRTTETGTGISLTDAAAIQYTASGNAADGAWIVIVIPSWRSTERTADAVILHHGADSDNYIRLFWEAAGHRWVFLMRAGGTDRTVATPEQAFTADTRITLGLTYDSSNAGGMKLFVDGMQAGVSADCGMLAACPDTLVLGDPTGAAGADAVIDFAAGWSRMLSADEMLRIAVNPATVVNRNTLVTYEGTLGAGDILSLDSLTKSATLFNRSTGARTNALVSVSGDIPMLTPGRKRAATDRTQTVIHTTGGAGGMEVRYRRRFL